MNKVLAIIENNKKILIGKVKEEKVADFGGIQYVFPGGGVEEGETNEQGAIREAKEETGLDVSEVKQIAFRVHPKTGKNIYYFHCITEQTEAKIDPNVNDDLRELIWIQKDELLKYMPTLNPEVKKYLSV